MNCRFTKKYMYRSAPAALEDVAAIQFLEHKRSGTVPWRVYRCWGCKMWHSTKDRYRPSRHVCLHAMRFKFKNRIESQRAAWEVGKDDYAVRCDKCKQLHFDPELGPPTLASEEVA